ncbi:MULTISPECIES: LexA family transcriptional regulator [unclassified Halanaerobium]|uniref:helix-turn-helix domain-containing protein n=1 Tax=unclassified Halanaerobium TaxID=2641197 RepID=UPI000DF315F0|nr:MULTISPECIES: LexA family transcriptional regulator [unclassified Halanaerobium]RCW49726.1 helix-turn-helix protein [Halanaerobium sp. MA284_MarDTE_T2]RCW88411.1 helix-turn-helix protein [Halanaerobium sp. DL-01]
MYVYNKDKLINLIKKAKGEDKTVSKFAKEMGVSRPYLNNLLNKKQKNPPNPDILQKVAENNNQVRYVELMVAAGYLDEKYILGDKNDKKVRSINKMLSEYIEKVEDINPREVVPSYNYDNESFWDDKKECVAEDYFIFPESYVTDSSYALKITNNNFKYWRIIKGDYILIRPANNEPANGSTILVIIRKGGDYNRTIKRYYIINDSKVRLEPDIENYGEIDKSEVKIIGFVDYMGRQY